MTWRDINIERFNQLKDKVVIDVRSPCEFESENIPGAINVPLLSNEERAQVGTIYATQGEARARRVAVDIICPKIPALIDQIVVHKSISRTLVVHCWRGGLRSEAVVSFLSIVGIDSFRLVGGYKSWRRSVVDCFNNDSFEFQAVILDGLTGAGKTEILQMLKERNVSIIDLEGLASHRGSVFGGIGLPPQPSQKNFEGRLWMELRERDNKVVFMEAEGKRIGRLAVPEFLFKRIVSSPRILVTGSLERRCDRLVRDYGQTLGKDDLLKSLSLLTPLKERLGKEYLRQLSSLLEGEEYFEFVRRLLVDYYDPLYTRHLKSSGEYELEVCGDDPVRAADDIVRLYIKAHNKTGKLYSPS